MKVMVKNTQQLLIRDVCVSFEIRFLWKLIISRFCFCACFCFPLGIIHPNQQKSLSVKVESLCLLS